MSVIVYYYFKSERAKGKDGKEEEERGKVKVG